MVAPDNYSIAQQFSLLAKLMDIHRENPFKSKSYAAAAFNIEKLPFALSALPPDQLFTVKGIGESTARKIIEILESGRLKALEELMNKTPAGVIDMLSIKGIGPKKIAVIWKEMEIESPGELLYACTENRLTRYKGFGEKTQQSIQESIQFFLKSQGQYLYAEIENYAIQLDRQFNNAFPEKIFEITGAFKRRAIIIEKLEWVSNVDIEALRGYFLKNGYTEEESLAESISFRTPEKILITINSKPTSLLHLTAFENASTEEFLQEWHKRYPKDDFSYSNEEEIFSSKNIQLIPAFLREKASIIEKALTEDFSLIIQPTDIKGIIHSHSVWSDGSNTIEEMAKACISSGLEYLVISDHSKSAAYANGLSIERIKEQHREIDQLNQQFYPFTIFKSIEADILSDGSLDYPDNILSTFDLVIASVHSNLKMNEEKAMLRLLTAIKNPYTTILGHMTGRLLLSRPGYPIDHKKIIDTCAEHNVVIEINANPRRLDMGWEWVDYAMEKNVLLSINPDAHEISEYDNNKYGVYAAQKGGLQAKQNLSSFSLKDFNEFLSAKEALRKK